jgi:hypothetical protein
MTGNLVLRFSTSENTLANWTSAVIRRMCHSQFSHVDLLLSDGNLLGASDQGPHAPFIVGNPEGVAIRPPNYQRFGYRRDMIIETDRADDIIAAAKSQLGKPFDPSALWGFLDDKPPGVRDWRNITHWFCAEHSTWSCEEGGLWLPLIKQLIISKDRVTPADLILLFATDPRWINRETFWQPIPGLVLDPGEK